MRIGIVGGRAELGMQVAAVVAATGSPSPPVALSLADAQTGHGCDLVIVDPLSCPAPMADGGLALLGEPACTVLVAHLPGEDDAAREAAHRWGASTLVELPRASRWLADLVSHACSTARSTVLAVVGATGGCGTSTLAVAAALAAGGDGGDCLLVDADPWSTGLDLGLGLPDAEGARWADVPIDASALVADTLRASLPRVGGTYVLTGDPRDRLDPRVTAAVRTGRSDFAHAVVDVGRDPRLDGGTAADAFLVVLPCTLAGVVGARRVLTGLPGERVALALRPTGWMPNAEVAAVLGCPRMVAVPRLRALPERAECGELTVGRIGRALAALGTDLWAGLG